MDQPNSTSKKQTSKSTDKSRVIETKPYIDLIKDDRLHLHAVNLNFLLGVGVVPPLIVLIYEYADYYDNLFRYDLLVFSDLATSFGLFKLNPDQHYLPENKQAEIIAREHIWTAGPLHKLVAKVKNNPTLILLPIEITMKLDGEKFAFVGSLLQLAIMFLDQKIQAAENSTVPMTDQGQAEMLMALIDKHMHHRISEAKEQARVAAPLDLEEKSRETERAIILHTAFEQIKANNFNEAAKTIRDYIIVAKPKKITDNRFFKGLLRMILEAVNLLIDKAKYLGGGLYGTQADQYCFLIGIIQRFLPFKLRRVFETGLYYSLHKGRKINRTLDVSDDSYFVKDNGELGLSAYLDDSGRKRRFCLDRAERRTAQRDSISKLLLAITSAQQNYAAIEHLTEEQCHDSAEPCRRSQLKWG